MPKKKTAQLHITLEPKEFARWKAEADKLGVAVTTWIHLKCRDVLKEAT